MTQTPRPRICYVLVADGWNRSAQMMWLSAHTLRLHEPSLEIVLVTDPRSRAAFERSAPEVLKAVDTVVTVEADVEDRRLRAFYLKTAFRRFVDGDLLYLDGDTLVIRPIRDVFDRPEEVAAALDFNNDGEWFPPQLRAGYTALGWTYPLPYYFNSGVLFMRDTTGTRDLSAEWSRRWMLLVEQGLPGDQEAFVSALYAQPVTWGLLPKAFNAMVVKRRYRFRDTRILHFFGSEVEQRGTLMAHLLSSLQATGQFDDAAYRRALAEGHPWGPGPEPWQLWKSRNYVRAVAAKLSRMVLPSSRRPKRVS